MKPERYQAGIVKDRLAWVYFAEDIDPLLADLARVTQERDALKQELEERASHDRLQVAMVEHRLRNLPHYNAEISQGRVILIEPLAETDSPDVVKRSDVLAILKLLANKTP